MKAVILARGYGTRLSEATGVRPKPMVESRETFCFTYVGGVGDVDIRRLIDFHILT